MLDLKVINAIANEERPTPIHQDNDEELEFQCPKCNGLWFGSSHIGSKSEYHCHDQNELLCQWSGSYSECFTYRKATLAKELLKVYDLLDKMSSLTSIKYY